MKKQETSKAKRAAYASAVGTTLEWYEFGIYGVIAALVLNEQFFPNLDPAIGLIAAFSTFAVGFIARPLGAVLLGHLGDRWGRKNTLIITLVMTGAVTITIGLLPTYAAIGIAAPIILVSLRFLQGVGLGGEWGGAVLLSTEHAPAKSRSLYGGIMAMGVPLGVLLSNGVFLIITLFVSPAVFSAWGWRIPFIASIIILAVGLWIRLKVSETPQFEEMKKNRAEHGSSDERLPVNELFALYPWKVVTATFVVVGSSAVAYLYLTFILSWGNSSIGYSTPVILGSICCGAVLWAATAPYWGRAGDRVGGMRRLFLGWGLVRTVSIIPFFLMVGSGNVVLLYVAMAAMGVIISATQVPAGAAIASLFPVRVRYTGTSFAYQLGNILGGGLTPVIATTIVATSMGINGVMAYVVVISIISTTAGLAFSKHRIDTPSSHLDPSATAESEGART